MISAYPASSEAQLCILLGEHNQRYPLGNELGLSESDMAELKASGVI